MSARNIGNIWWCSSLTVPAPLHTSFSERTLRRKRFTQLDERECVLENSVSVDVNDNQMPHVYVRMKDLHRRCKHCYSRGARKEVVECYTVCNFTCVPNVFVKNIELTWLQNWLVIQNTPVIQNSTVIKINMCLPVSSNKTLCKTDRFIYVDFKFIIFFILVTSDCSA